jgi:predicted nucleotidyltransferase
VRQLKELLKEDAANISRELSRLADMGILACRTEGRQKYYHANKNCPVFDELRGLLVKTVGLVDVLRADLMPLTKKIEVAFIYGSFAANSAKAASDVDLMVIGSCSFAEAVEMLSRAQDKLGREINPSVYPVNEFRRKISMNHHFLKTVLRGPKIFIMGDEDDLARLAK